jgi:diamine N-acetyltransferase
MNKIQIKRADFSDAQTISFLGRKTFTETFGDLFSKEELSEYLDKTFNIDKLQVSLHKNENIFGILFYQSNPVGYYKIKLARRHDHSADANCVQLQKIYILGDYLHLKLGKEMLEDILNLKEIKDCKKVWLAVLQTNVRATAFYKRHGFEKSDVCYYNIGSLRLEYDLMIKKLKHHSGLLPHK